MCDVILISETRCARSLHSPAFPFGVGSVGWDLRSVKSVGTLSADLGNITFSPRITYTGSKSRLGSEP